MSFRLFLFEQEHQSQWFEQVPSPKMVGNFLLSIKNLLNQGQQNPQQAPQQETFNQRFANRGFPLSKGATDFLSAVPYEQNLTQAYSWLVREGLYEASLVRKKKTLQANEDLRQQLGPQFDQMFVDRSGRPIGQITEDMIYSPAAHQAFPALKQWYASQDPASFEPNGQIKLEYGRDDDGKPQVISFSLRDVNGFINHLNKLAKTDLFEEMHFGGTDGFIEWVEDGPWAEKIGNVDEAQPWRTKHGIPLHNPKMKRNDDGQVAYELGDGNIIMPLRNNVNTSKLMSTYTLKILSHTIATYKKDIQQLPPELQERVTKVLNHAEKGLVPMNQKTYGGSRGLANDGNFDKFDENEADQYLAHVLLTRAGLHVRASINDMVAQEIAQGQPLEQAAKNVAANNDFGINTPEKIIEFWGNNSDPQWPGLVKRVRNQDGVPVTFRHDKKSGQPTATGVYSRYQVSDDQVKQALATKQFNIGSTDKWLMQKTLYEGGYHFLKRIGNAEEIFHKLMGNVVPEEMKPQVLRAVEDIRSTELEYPLPGVKMKTPHEIGRQHGNYKNLDSNQLQKLLADGWNFERKDYKKDKNGAFDNADPEKALEMYLVKDGQKLHLWRKTPGDNWMALDDNDSGTPFKYKKNIPALVQAPNVRYGGGKNYVSDQSGLDMKTLLQDMQTNPQKYGYGIGKAAADVDSDAKSLAYNLVQRKSLPGLSYLSGVSPEDAKGVILQGILTKSGDRFKLLYGDLGDQEHIRNVLETLGEAGTGLPAIENPDDRLFWLKRLQESISQGKTPQAVQGATDFSAAAWQNKVGMPQEVLNAFLYCGMRSRNSRAMKFALNDLKAAGVGGMNVSVVGDDGEAKSVDWSDGDDKRAELRDARLKSSTMRASFGIDKERGLQGTEIEKTADPQEALGYNPAREKRNPGISKLSGYEHIYNDTLSNLVEADPRDISIGIRSALTKIKTTPNPLNPSNFRTLATLDGTVDAALGKLKKQMSAMSRLSRGGEISQFVKQVVAYLGGTSVLILKDPKNKPFLDLDLDTTLRDILRSQYDSIMMQIANAGAEQPQPAPQPTSTPTPAQNPIAARMPAREPQPSNLAQITPTEPPQAPPAKPGLSMRDLLNRKKKEESYLFRDRLTKLIETGAVYDRSKGTFNWWGAVGLPGGKCIDGEVEDRQENPDGKGKKRNVRKRQ